MNKLKKEKKNMSYGTANLVPNQAMVQVITDKFVQWDTLVKTKNSLGCINATPAPQCVAKQEKVKTMDTRTEAQQAKDYLIQSLDVEMFRKREDEYVAFNLRPEHPTTVGELRAAIKAGWLTVPEDAKDEKKVYYWGDYVTYGDPTKKPDQNGFDKAMVQMTADASKVKDQVVVMGAEKGLEALDSFKAKTYH